MLVPLELREYLKKQKIRKIVKNYTIEYAIKNNYKKELPEFKFRGLIEMFTFKDTKEGSDYWWNHIKQFHYTTDKDTIYVKL